MEHLLILSMLLALLHPITGNVYVNSSSNEGNTQISAPQPTNQTQLSLGSSHLIGRTEVAFKINDQEMGTRDKTVMDKFVGAADQEDVVSSGHSEEPTISNMWKTPPQPSSTDIKVKLAAHSVSPYTRDIGVLTQTPWPAAGPINTTPTQQAGDQTKNESTELSFTSQGSGRNLLHGRHVTPEALSEEPFNEIIEDDWSDLATLIPTGRGLWESSTGTMETDSVEHAQYRPPAQTVYDILTTGSRAHTSPTVRLVLQSNPSTSTLANKKHAFASAGSESVTDRVSSNLSISEADLGVAEAGSTISAGNRQHRTFPVRETPASSTPQPGNATQPAKAATAPNQQPKGAGSQGTGTSTGILQRPGTTAFKSLAPTSTSFQQNTADTSTQSTTHLKGHRYLTPLDKDVRLGVSHGSVPVVKQDPTPTATHIPGGPCATGLGPCASPGDLDVVTEVGISNGSMLVWADLSRTLSFAWELHVFGSASLFLLLAAGATLGLALAPSMCCPHRGLLAFTNGLLLLAGAVRAAYFLLDPYGSRQLLPQPVATALCTLPLPLLTWAQAAMAVLVLKGAKVNLLPPSLQRPPLLVVLVVLQCTLLLAADLLSPALSPSVPIVLQSLTLTAGLALCLGYLCVALPRLSSPQAGCTGDQGLCGPKLRVLARTLAVCALLGVLCCLLHAYTCLWLYGLLGDCRRFRWAWWLCQFWARLLELAWAFGLMLLASWVFWRPRRGQTGRATGQGGAGTGDLASPGQSSSSSHTHTCWAKIVQSLKGRPNRKTDSNGMGGASGGSGSGSVAGEVPNNCSGQDRPGADISKSLIRNRDTPKESNRARNQRSVGEASVGSLLRLQTLSRQHRCSSSSVDRDKESAVSLYDFDLRPPSPIDLSRSIDEALHREHLLQGGGLFHPLGTWSPPRSPPPQPPGSWMRRNSEPQVPLSESSGERSPLTESSAALERSIPSAVPSRQVTAPPTPTHQGPRWVSGAPVPSSVSCPVSLHPSPSTGQALTPSTDDTRPFLTPEMDRVGSQLDSRGGRSYLKVNCHDDSASVSSDIIDL
ncbi:proline-rich transmembrane protein 3 [Electrophorus electricus]|uniref:proline-rich transmembrane protein 3 n=1 Tax=Electrophorus electricus TaxID=8005 RepID=UPI0015D05079|nr:proline-rich transmembrane protein 3 [Electrophorus electricus]